MNTLRPITLKWPARVPLSPEDEAAVDALDYTPRAVGFVAARHLRYLCRLIQPRRIIEAGTFVGMSTRAMLASERIYTCDKGGQQTTFSDRTIKAHWQTSSAEMLARLVGKRVTNVDFVFYDANIRSTDRDFLKHLIHPRTVFGVHDYKGNEKGVRAMAQFIQLAPSHWLVKPVDEASTVAVLAPEDIARRIAAGEC